ncbi:hypothetical protein RF11_06718 [Thelohanellus kitauei]|uniref:Uncharacterized protein n=1 Tax=Thelohanellus kitauei TaxID=669202 RepID=A0A0C2JGD4_THEKT|nr:hypothetical protein RF11_06718 [Thelohanellus kitauei]
MVLCRENNEVKRLARLIGDVIKHTPENYAIEILRFVLDFHKDAVRKQIEHNSDPNESVCITIFHLTALSIIMESAGYIKVTHDHACGTITNAIDFCFYVMDHFGDNESVWEKASDVMVHLFDLLKLYEELSESFSEMIVERFYRSNFSCITTPFLILNNYYWGKYFNTGWTWWLSWCIFEHSLDYLENKDSNDYPLLVERLMKVYNPLIARQYYGTVDTQMSGSMIPLASHGLLLEGENAFNECVRALIELFLHPSIEVRSKDKRKGDSTVVRFYLEQVEKIVKSSTVLIEIVYMSFSPQETSRL